MQEVILLGLKSVYVWVTTERILFVMLTDSVPWLVINTYTTSKFDFAVSERLALSNAKVALAKCVVVVPCNGTATRKVSLDAIVIGATNILVRFKGIGLCTA